MIDSDDLFQVVLLSDCGMGENQIEACVPLAEYLTRLTNVELCNHLNIQKILSYRIELV